MEPIRSFIKNGLALHPNKFCKFQITGSEDLYASLPLLIQLFKKDSPDNHSWRHSKRFSGEHQIKPSNSLFCWDKNGDNLWGFNLNTV
jgi:hypothetical protein